MHPKGVDLLRTIAKLLAKRYGTKITYEIVERTST